MAATLALQREQPFSMSDDVKKGLLTAYSHLMRPLVRVAIKNGVPFSDLAEAIKQSYVSSAREDFTLPRRKMSGSRIAILTGLTRKDVKRIVDILDSGIEPETGHVHRAARVLEGWHIDPDFTQADGVPAALPFEGQPASFTELVRRYSGDMPARAMLEELKRVDAAVETADGEIKAISRYYISSDLTPDNAKYFGDVIHDLAATIAYNFDVEKTEPPRFERWVMNERIEKKSMHEFREIVNKYGQSFLELLDGWLSRHEVPTTDVSRRPLRVTRVGVYLYEADSDGSKER